MTLDHQSSSWVLGMLSRVGALSFSAFRVRSPLALVGRGQK
jgi:hypothetical protein